MIIAAVVGYTLWYDVKQDRIRDLTYTASVLKSYYQLSFYQWELSLVSVGERLLSITGDDKEIKRTQFANDALVAYQELLAFGLSDTEGQLMTFSGSNPGDSLPNLMRSENSRRSFKQARNSYGLSIGEVYYFDNVKDWILPIRVAIRNDNDEVLAVNTSAIRYSGLTTELAQFGFDERYRVHMVNGNFNTTQLYYPLNIRDYDGMLRQDAGLYSEISESQSDDFMTFFEARNNFENYSVLGAKVSLPALHHELIISVNRNVLWVEYWGILKYILVFYVLINVATGFLFRYVWKKEKKYLNALNASQVELQNYAENLERLVEKRTEELKFKNDALETGKDNLEKALRDLKEAQHHLIQSEKMASLGVLAAGVGHEINNPLNFIKNGVAALSNKVLRNGSSNDGEVSQLFETINDGVERASNIVKSLSHFSRKNAALNEQCDVKEIIDNCLIILTNKLQGKVEVIRNYTIKSHLIKGNEGKLHLAILNILSNAEQAICDKGVIKIDTELRNDQLIITVEDDGHGIKEDNLVKINDPFFSTKPPGDGTGLGLFITYSIIEEHKGVVSVESIINKGTKFIVTLPVNSD